MVPPPRDEPLAAASAAGSGARRAQGCAAHHLGKEEPVTTCETTIEAPRQAVWDALVDVRSYPRWLVGAVRIRAVDDGWPTPGTAFHHEVGLGGPLTIADKTVSVSADPPRRLELDIRARPLFSGTVVFELHDDGADTRIVMHEHPTGVFRLVSPLAAPIVQLRNRASLRQLEDRVRRAQGTP